MIRFALKKIWLKWNDAVHIPYETWFRWFISLINFCYLLLFLGLFYFIEIFFFSLTCSFAYSSFSRWVKMSFFVFIFFFYLKVFYFLNNDSNLSSWRWLAFNVYSLFRVEKAKCLCSLYCSHIWYCSRFCFFFKLQLILRYCCCCFKSLLEQSYYQSSLLEHNKVLFFFIFVALEDSPSYSFVRIWVITFRSACHSNRIRTFIYFLIFVFCSFVRSFSHISHCHPSTHLIDRLKHLWLFPFEALSAWIVN